AARFRADTQASRAMLERGFAALGEDAGADALCRWLAEGGFDPASELPVEVELELTTDDPLPDTTLRPRGGRVPRRAVADVAAVRRLAEELARLDDRLLWL